MNLFGNTLTLGNIHIHAQNLEFERKEKEMDITLQNYKTENHRKGE
jgi:hypothetical protein